ncbi:hypothetical protein QN277_022600 [Acacia crassicarpa]|nr:hypothetical protein QN277_022600 [Acacia crassicarpa]
MAFLKTYKHEELGEKLKKLRPPAKGGDGFSLRELNDRLVKLREMDEKENAQSTPDVFGLADLKNVSNKLEESDNQERKTTLQICVKRMI